MNMQIETFEIEDASNEASAMANDAAALELIEKLGLTGQRAIMNKETVTRLPYPVMDENEFYVYRALCPKTVPPEEYSIDPIPVRILQVIEHAKSLGCFGRLEIWCPNPAVFRDDPVLVGVVTKKSNYGNWNDDTFYMLARWGKVLQPFEKLAEIATKVCRKQRLGKLAEMLVEVQQAIEKTKATEDIKVLSASCYVSL